MRRLSAVFAVVAAVLFAVPAAASSPESQLFTKINQARQAAGVDPLSQNHSDLLEVARRHSARMAEQNNLHHNDNLPNEVSGWRALGENVGTGPDVESIHQAFMDSPSHRAQILEGVYREAAVGVVVVNGTLWVTQIFSLRDAPTTGPKALRAPRAARAATPVTAEQPAPADAPVQVEGAVFDARTMHTSIVMANEEDPSAPFAMALPLLRAPRRSPLAATSFALFLLVLVAAANVVVWAKR